MPEQATPADSSYHLIRKWAIEEGATPTPMDTKYNLLQKILIAKGGTPKPGDLEHDLLRKILEATGGGGGENLSGAGLVWGPSPTVLDNLDTNLEDFFTNKTEFSFPTLVQVLNDVNYLSQNTISLLIPNLADVGHDVLIQSQGVMEVFDLSGLEDVGNDLSISGTASLNMPVLDLSSLTNVGGNLSIDTAASYTVPILDLSSLVSLTGFLYLSNLIDFAALNLPVAVTIGEFNVESCPALVSVNVPNWIPTDGSSIRIYNCALDAASVEGILARCVAAGVTTCTIDLSGGGNTGLASLSLAGQADYAALVLAGNSVTLNP